ncbi:tlde1 domain-containing protein [Lichenibacterium dinghuense]|uniref:tlde1 domain-containing protein n=1 Tax=Lichenibacterium dinghuense TaxID=2895977 RepID=UPI001F2BA8B5|nr:tlde1 domain-containing protein [Lichenibacterium sp. 6Y81]
MTDATFTTGDVAPFDHGRLSQRHSTWTIAGAGAVTLGVLVGSWLLDHRAMGVQPFGLAPGAARLTAAFHTPPSPALPDLPRAEPRAEAPAEGATAEADPQAVPALPAAPGASLIDPGFARGPSPAALADSAPLASRFAAAGPAGAVEKPQPGPVVAVVPESGPGFAMIVPLPGAHDEAPAPAAEPPLPPAALASAEPKPQVETVPLPTPRPAFPWAAPEQYRQGRRALARNTDTAPTLAAPGPVAAAAPADNRGFLEKFFGAFKPSGSALGYASPEDGLFGRAGLPGSPATPRDRYTAVYDISAHTVYMPDGSKLEAHSGLGGKMDDPRHVTARNTGPTPPHLYDLSLRESLFHGVQALRLNPVGGGGVFGRDGLLAHTYMLGPNGQSNGCVSFRDYAAFLRAYQNGQVKRLVVVAGGMN